MHLRPKPRLRQAPPDAAVSSPARCAGARDLRQFALLISHIRQETANSTQPTRGRGRPRPSRRRSARKARRSCDDRPVNTRDLMASPHDTGRGIESADARSRHRRARCAPNVFGHEANVLDQRSVTERAGWSISSEFTSHRRMIAARLRPRNKSNSDPGVHRGSILTAAPRRSGHRQSRSAFATTGSPLPRGSGRKPGRTMGGRARRYASQRHKPARSSA